MSTPHCFVCGRWNDPSGGPDSHSGGCPESGNRYPGSPEPEPEPSEEDEGDEPFVNYEDVN